MQYKSTKTVLIAKFSLILRQLALAMVLHFVAFKRNLLCKRDCC